MSDYQAATESAAVFDLSDHPIIEISGRDAAEFLHNLSTQDIKNLPVGESREAFLTTNKARVLAYPWITRCASGQFRLLLMPGQAGTVLAHLDRHLISEQVELADRTKELGTLRLLGPKVTEVLDRTAIGRTSTRRCPMPDGLDLTLPIDDVAAIRQRLLDAGMCAGDSETCRTLRIEAGLPECGIDIDENRLAMEVNRPQALSYTKGCYLGQETIVMARDRGQVNRLLMGLHILPSPAGRGAAPPLPSPPGRGAGGEGAPLAVGAKLFRGGDEVGQVTSSVFSPKLGQVIALAYLKRGGWDPGTEVVIDPTTDGRTALVSVLPFASPADVTLP